MDNEIKQLIIEGQRHSPGSPGRKKAGSKIADVILRSRKICRPPTGQTLQGIYQEVYQQLKQHLEGYVNEHIDKCNPQEMEVREWANTLRNKAFKEVLNDTQLKKLALVAQQHSANSESRQQALIELVNAILLSCRLCRPHRGLIPDNLYELIYDEAVNQTLVYVCQKIDNYDPERGIEQKFINWVNFRLDKMILKSYSEFKQQANKSVNSLEELAEISQAEVEDTGEARLRECLEEDADKVFSKEHIRNYPEANFRAIALATLSGKSWEEISAELGGIKVPTLSSFFRRSCKKFASQFKEYL